MDTKKIGEDLHEHVPAGWYHESLKKDFFQRIWHKTRFSQIKKVSENAKNVLDVGCADGIFSKVVLDSTQAESLIGIDIIKTSIDWAKKHWKRNTRMKFEVGDAHKLNFKANTFDAIYCLEALEHVADPVVVLGQFKRIMKKGGFGIFLVPSDNNLFKIVWWLWLTFYPRGWVWKDTHIQTYRGDYLTKACRKTGFKIELDKKFNLGMLHLVKVRKV